MKRIRKLLPLLFALLLLTGCGKKTLRLGGGTAGNSYDTFANNLAEAAKEQTGYQLKVKRTAGAAANLRLLSDGYLDLALVQSDTAADALAGEGSFSGAPVSGFHVAATLFDEQCHLVVPAGSSIASLEDLPGRRVSLGAVDSGTLTVARALLNAAGIREDALEGVYLSFDEAAAALEAGTIDAFFCVGAAPMQSVSALAGRADVRLVPVTLAPYGFSGYSLSSVPARTYRGQEEEIPTWTVGAVLAAADTISPEAEAAVVSLLKSSGAASFLAPAPAKEAEAPKGPRKLSIDMYLTLALAVPVLFAGDWLRKKLKFLCTFCIPAPVVGGLVFSLFTLLLYVLGIAEPMFDETLKNVCMVLFFTTVGFQADIKVIRTGGKALAFFLGLVVVLIFSQNVVGILLAKLMGMPAAMGVATASIPMVGGHGTAGAFGPVLEDLGFEGGTAVCTAAATFGLIAGSLMGGPLGKRLIESNHLAERVFTRGSEEAQQEEKTVPLRSLTAALLLLILSMGVGTLLSALLSKTGLTFPVYIGTLLTAAVIRNVSELTGRFTVPMEAVGGVGDIALSLFLGAAMVTLKLWQLASLALPLCVLLIGQTALMFVFARFAVFKLMGSDYEAAVLTAGTCGFGMGATPNAMANMQVLTSLYGPAVKAYLLVPIVGSMFADFINSLTVTLFINLL